MEYHRPLMEVAAYQQGIYPRSEEVVAATRDLERGRTTREEVAGAFDRATREFFELQRRAGLDYFSDGLLSWQDLFRPLVEASRNVTAQPLVRWFDNNSFFRAPVVEGPLGFADPPKLIHDDTPAPRLATLPSPYLFSRAAEFHGDRDSLMLEMAREILRPAAQALAAAGAEVVGLQEPWLGFFGAPDEAWDPFSKALAEISDSLEAELHLHVYYGDASSYAARLQDLPVAAVGIDFLECDPADLGKRWKVGLVAGCLDGRASRVESPEVVASFARTVAETLEPPALYLSSNSDLELLPEVVARQKVQALGEAARLLKEELK